MMLSARTFLWLEANEWTALATLAAVIVALWVPWRERKRSDKLVDEERTRSDASVAEERRLTREALDLDRERWSEQQAAAERSQADLVGVLPTAGADGDVAVRIINHSVGPIMDVRLFALTAGLFRENPLGPSLGPGAVRHAAPPAMFGDLINSGDRIGFTFRDNGGRYWARYVNGSLVSLRGTDPEAVLSKPAPWPNH